uniref:Uncharacterized protein n=1 Tax=Panagrolaimus sp. JU765 TaxID=591449 RepID=A0AC34QX48_9BILA
MSGMDLSTPKESSLVVPTIKAENDIKLTAENLQNAFETLSISASIDAHASDESIPEALDNSLAVNASNNNVDECPGSPPISLNEQFHFNHFDAFATPDGYIVAPPDHSEEDFGSDRTMQSSTVDSDAYYSEDDDNDPFDYASRSA